MDFYGIIQQGAQDHHIDASSSSDHQPATGPLSDLSSLLRQLPMRRGLSKHYEGKSRSFTSLSNVKCVEDLVKVEQPYSKKLKSCKSYVGLGDSQRASRPPVASSRVVSETLPNPRGSCSLLAADGGDSFLGSRSPNPPHRSTSTNSTISNQTVLLA
ncbi:hypothetical protein CJ030_MR6G021433 [Morella rubra]|uniref:Uncharacterized protein n=1 Tax=Morella rubra TaxID=262757 RepID=A0A6A1VHN5_9ROSI|nr:hypothetical protein CJ030_MR6G021433 [Morella rubra]